MRALALGLCFTLTALPAAAQTISDEIGTTGLAATEARLAALATPTDEDRFALAGVRFLGAVEQALHQRWNMGLLPSMSGLPFFSLPIPDNPNPPPFQPAMIADLFRDATARMPGVADPLAAIPDDSAFGLEIDLADLWFDIDGDGKRSTSEGALDAFGPMLLGWRWSERDPATPAPVVRFDVADAAWLSAYSHFIAGFANTLLAYDPTTPITEVMGARAQLDTMRGSERDDMMIPDEQDWIDIAAVVLRTLNQTPDKARAADALTAYLAMIDDNRAFWRRADAETDNDREWIPNGKQTAALGFTLPPDTSAVWQAVLGDAEAVLRGKRLVPYLWLGDDAGVNVGRMFTDPRPIDLAMWIQGLGALPYIEKGTLISSQNFMIFTQMMEGDAMLFMVLLN
jgi:hypothetical protein